MQITLHHPEDLDQLRPYRRQQHNAKQRDRYRASWQTALGGAPTKLVEDNQSRWSGDHIFDPDLVPGIILSNVKLEDQPLRGIDIAPTVLSALGLPACGSMTGRSLLPSHKGEPQA